VRALIWDYYDEERFGAPMILAIALSDEADDRGQVFQSHAALAKKTRQGERSVAKQMRRLECSGLVVCAERSAGGAGKFNRYQFHLPLLITPNNPGLGTGLTPSEERGSGTDNPVPGTGFEQSTIYKDLKDNVSNVSPFGVPAEREDLRLAAWMFERLKTLNPKHREPHYTSWVKDIRKMREHDKRERREIAELFAWCNAHPFWQGNVLSPGTLRRQWDRLELQRMTAGQTGTKPNDRRCSWDKGGERCIREGVFGRTDGRRYCKEHEEAEERERASA
jgi:hypothetical protein